MKLLCVILNYRTVDMTIRCIRSARAALRDVPSYRIDVVDNDSRDGSYQRLVDAVHDERWRDVNVLRSDHNGGFGAGNNFAIRPALASDDPPEFVYLLNSDAFPEPDAVVALLEFMETHPRVGIAGSGLNGPNGEPHISAFRFPSLESEALGGARLGLLTRLMPEREIAILPRPESTRQVDWLAGASMMIRRQVLEEVGLFDERFFLYFEETDLCRRAWLSGWPTWYVLESRVTHVGHASTGLHDLSRPMPRYWFDSRRHYFRKNHGRAYTWAANTAQALGLTTYKVRARLQRKDDPDPSRFWRDFIHYNFLTNRP